MTLSMIAIRSSFVLRTVPTLVLAAKDLTIPKDFCEHFDGVKYGNVVDFSILVRCTRSWIYFCKTWS